MINTMDNRILPIKKRKVMQSTPMPNNDTIRYKTVEITPSIDMTPTTLDIMMVFSPQTNDKKRKTMIMTHYNDYPEILKKTLEPHFKARKSLNGQTLYRHVHIQGGNGRTLGHTGFVCQKTLKGEKKLRRLALTQDARVAALVAVASEFDSSLLTQSSMKTWLEDMTSLQNATEWISNVYPRKT